MLAASVLGTIPTWILVALALFVAWRVSAGGGGSAVSELSKSNEVLKDALKTERDGKEKLGGEVRDLRVQLAELSGRTDFAAALGAALGPILEWTAGHELRAQERHEASMNALDSNTRAVLNVLELVAQRLGPEPNGGDHVSGADAGELAA